MRRHLKTCVLACLFVTACAQAQTYQIKLDRPLHPGNRFRVHHTAAEKDEATRAVRGKAEKEARAFSAEMLAVQEVLEVDRDHKPIRTRFVIEKMTETRDGKSAEVMASNQVVFESLKEGKRLFYAENQGISDAATRVLRIFLGPEEAKNMDADALLGTSVPREVGASWSIDVGKLKDQIGLPPGHVLEKDAQATGKLAAVTNVLGVPALHVLIQMKGRCSPNMGLDMEMRKRGLEFVESLFSVEFSGLFPTNAVLPQLQLTMRQSLAGRSRIVGTEADEVSRMGQLEKSSRWEPLPPGK